MRFLILFLLVAGACSRTETAEPATLAPDAADDESKQSAEEAPAEPTQDAGVTEGAQKETPPKVGLVAPATVELVDAGTAPRRELRATFEVGAKETLRIESDWTLETVYGPLIQSKAKMPSLVYVLQIEAKEATTDRTQFAFRVAKVAAKPGKGVQPAQAKAAKQAASSLEGAAGSFWIDARGLLQEFAIDAPSDASLLVNDMVDQIKQGIRLSSLPLPEEPVGKGAKWTATQIVEQRTAKIKQTSSFELVETKGVVARATSTHVAEAPAQKLALPGSAEGKSYRLDKVEFSGDSKGAWPLNQFGPNKASEHTLSVLGLTAKKPRHESVIMALETELEVKTER